MKSLIAFIALSLPLAVMAEVMSCRDSSQNGFLIVMNRNSTVATVLGESCTSDTEPRDCSWSDVLSRRGAVTRTGPNLLIVAQDLETIDWSDPDTKKECFVFKPTKRTFQLQRTETGYSGNLTEVIEAERNPAKPKCKVPEPETTNANLACMDY